MITNLPRRAAAAIGLVLVLLFVPGCPTPPAPVPPPARMPSYGELVQRYNANLAALDRLWARAIAEVWWYDDEGHKHYEQGDDSRVIVVLPDNLALTIGKAGQNFLWAGANAQYYWLFQLGGDHKVLDYGTHARVGLAGTRQLPVPVAPRDLPRLLGIVKLDTPARPDAAPVNWDPQMGGRFVIEPPGTRSRLYLDPLTAMPQTVELLDANGKARVSSALSHPEPVQVAGVSPGRQPRIATVADITLQEQKDRLKLYLRDMSDGREGDRIKPQVFDLEFLRQALRPDEVRNLDEPAKR